MINKVKNWFFGESLSQGETEAHMVNEMLKDIELDRLMDINKLLEANIKDLTLKNQDLRIELAEKEQHYRKVLKKFKNEKKDK